MWVFLTLFYIKSEAIRGISKAPRKALARSPKTPG